jgi:hypothetical protein
VATLRWTDDRLDDLHADVKANDHRLDTVQDMSQTNQRDIRDLKAAVSSLQAMPGAQAHSRMERMLLGAAIASPIVTLILGLVKHG